MIKLSVHFQYHFMTKIGVFNFNLVNMACRIYLFCYCFTEDFSFNYLNKYSYSLVS